MTIAANDPPTLYHRGKSGAIYSWKVWTEGADIVTEYGLVDVEKNGSQGLLRIMGAPSTSATSR